MRGVPARPDCYVCGCARAMVPARRPPDQRFAPLTVRPESARVPRAEMLLRDLVLRRGCCWPSLLLHCALHPLWGFVQVSGGRGVRATRARSGQDRVGGGVGGTAFPGPWLPASAPLVAAGESLGRGEVQALPRSLPLYTLEVKRSGKTRRRPQSWPAEACGTGPGNRKGLGAPS